MTIDNLNIDEYKLTSDAHIMTVDELDAYNHNKIKTSINLYGDKTIIGEVVQLLAYIRHSLQNNQNCHIDLHIANTVANPDFMLEVNGLQVPDLVTEFNYQIN